MSEFTGDAWCPVHRAMTEVRGTFTEDTGDARPTVMAVTVTELQCGHQITGPVREVGVALQQSSDLPRAYSLADRPDPWGLDR